MGFDSRQPIGPELGRGVQYVTEGSDHGSGCRQSAAIHKSTSSEPLRLCDVAARLHTTHACSALPCQDGWTLQAPRDPVFLEELRAAFGLLADGDAASTPGLARPDEVPRAASCRGASLRTVMLEVWHRSGNACGRRGERLWAPRGAPVGAEVGVPPLRSPTPQGSRRRTGAGCLTPTM